MKLGNRIKELLTRLQIRQQDLAKLIGVSTSTIGMYEQNRRQPDPDTLHRLSVSLDTSVDYLLGRTDHPLSPNKLAQLIPSPGSVAYKGATEQNTLGQVAEKQFRTLWEESIRVELQSKARQDLDEWLGIIRLPLAAEFTYENGSLFSRFVLFAFP